jgi:hypothetical protein
MASGTDVTWTSASDRLELTVISRSSATGTAPDKRGSASGDWNGTGQAGIGVFRLSTGEWFLDINGNGQWDGCEVDKCFGPFGADGDLPIVGDWNGTGQAGIGVFRPSTGDWLLDINGNGKFDGCAIGACLGPLGQPGGLPVVGQW